MSIDLREGDCRAVLAAMIERGEYVDSVVTDPPYGLTSITKRFGAEGAAAAQEGKDGAFKRLSGGFMGKQWDGTGIENDPEFWSLVLRVMKPGAYLVAFSSSRTYHKMATAIEDAGFIIHPMIGWAFGSGFPKATNAARMIDKALGAVGGVSPKGDPVRRLRPGADQIRNGTWEKLSDREYQPGIYVPDTSEAAQWEGWHYGGQARKPALEPICVAQAPFSEKTGALNILKHGVGAVNIDGCRVPSEGGAPRTGEASQERRYADNGSTNFALLPGPRGGAPEGRWPANLIHDGSPEVVALFPDSNGQQGASTDADRSQVNVYGAPSDNGKVYAPRGDSGSAARFFESYPFDDEPVFYCSKAGKTDRAGSAHPTCKPIKLMRSLVRHVTPPGGLVLDPFAGTGTTGQACLDEGVGVVLIEREAEYLADIRRRFGLEQPLDEFDEFA